MKLGGFTGRHDMASVPPLTNLHLHPWSDIWKADADRVFEAMSTLMSTLKLWIGHTCLRRLMGHGLLARIADIDRRRTTSDKGDHQDQDCR